MKRVRADILALPRHFDNSDKLCEWVREQCGSTCLLSFSCGKDAVVAWLKLKKYFERIIPVYMYLVPGLEFIEDGIRYYEKFFGERIIQLPHASMYRLLNNLVYQAPQNCLTVENARLRPVDYDEAFEHVRADFGLGPNVYCATGVRALDSLVRWASVKKHGSINHKRKTFFPVYDWNKEKVVTALRESGVKLPVDYGMFGRTFDGLDWRFLKPIKDRYPRDYQKILEWFPMAEMEVLRMEWRSRYVTV